MDGPRTATPLHVPRPGGPWHGMREDLARYGNAVAYTTWGEWLPGVLAHPGLHQVLGRDWARYRRTSDAVVRHRFAVSRLLIKHMAASALGTTSQSLDLAYGLGGRPYLRGLDQLGLSLSHSGDLVAVGLSRIGRIGVDVEHADRAIRLDLVRSQILTGDETAALDLLPEADRGAHALRLWTLKEAYVKALGQGRRLRFNEFGFGLGDGRLRTPDGRPASRGDWGFATSAVLGGRYLISVACQDEGLDPAGDIFVRTMLDQDFLSAMAQQTA
ncbi:4'-phosphopantetheinyl transferase family protein [Streptomyces sp. NPDC060322]|uniref:4'-phosphopantetheinyl transferase family protein n=1 Tax=unclassified Streptomyces TaxID=2593676 RepID=UPI0036487626